MGKIIKPMQRASWHKDNILNFPQVLAQRQTDIRTRRYTKIARKIAVRPFVWLGGGFLGMGLFWFSVIKFFSWVGAV